jgi:hypothetical protein
MSPRKKAVTTTEAMPQVVTAGTLDPAFGTISTAVIAHIEAKVAAKPEPDPIVSRVLVAGPPCALDATHAPAKCVVARTDEGKEVRLLTPAGTTILPKDDIFYTLPTGAKVQKVADGKYLVYRMGVQEAPLCEAQSARDAVTLFLQMVK